MARRRSNRSQPRDSHGRWSKGGSSRARAKKVGRIAGRTAVTLGALYLSGKGYGIAGRAAAGRRPPTILHEIFEITAGSRVNR